MLRKATFAAALSLTLFITACGSPLSTPELVPVDTAVALTLQAIAAAATPVDSETPAPLPTVAPEVLARSLYFLNQDGNGLWQIFRLAVDGHTTQQITFEPISVDAYDVSPVDSGIAYITNNQLYLVDAAGAGRRLLIDGGPVDDNNRWTNGVASPVFSPDGQTLAYTHGGLTFMNLSTGAENRVLFNQIDTSAGFPIVGQLFAPNSYSTDGAKLLINIGFYEGGTFGFYSPANNVLVRFQRSEGGNVCCHLNWIPDGSGVYITNPTLGMFESGLYYADAATGNVTTLLPGSASDGTFNFADAAQVGPDNKLYFFFNNLPEIPVSGHTPLYLVRSEPDGVTGRTQLLVDAFQNINEVLWADDASLAVVLMAASPDEYSGGEARAVYPDGRAGIVLVPHARDLRWGP